MLWNHFRQQEEESASEGVGVKGCCSKAAIAEWLTGTLSSAGGFLKESEAMVYKCAIKERVNQR
jgi:hypothetical protein